MISSTSTSLGYPSGSTGSALPSQPSATDVAQFDASMSTAATSDADVLAQIDKNIQDQIMRSIIQKTFKKHLSDS